jgi:hypothetical protein
MRPILPRSRRAASVGGQPLADSAVLNALSPRGSASHDRREGLPSPTVRAGVRDQPVRAFFSYPLILSFSLGEKGP